MLVLGCSSLQAPQQGSWHPNPGMMATSDFPGLCTNPFPRCGSLKRCCRDAQEGKALGRWEGQGKASFPHQSSSPPLGLSMTLSPKFLPTSTSKAGGPDLLSPVFKQGPATWLAAASSSLLCKPSFQRPVSNIRHASTSLNVVCHQCWHTLGTSGAGAVLAWCITIPCSQPALNTASGAGAHPRNMGVSSAPAMEGPCRQLQHPMVEKWWYHWRGSSVHGRTLTQIPMKAVGLCLIGEVESP